MRVWGKRIVWRTAVWAAVLMVAASLGSVWVTASEPQSASAGTVPSGFQESVVFSGLTEPTVIRFASDGRVFIAEKSGLVKVFDSLTDTTPTIFADLRTQVFNYWDRGLLGLALDPNFPAAPYVYVLYSYDHVLGDPAPPPRWGTPGATSDNCPTPPGPTTDGCVTSGRLSRLQAAGNVMTGSEQVLVEDWCNQFQTHSVGAVEFGPDGALYASAGEGANADVVDYGQKGNPVNPCGDPPGGVGGSMTPPTAEGGALRSQDLRTAGDPVTLDGSIIRVNPADGTALPTNPMAGSSDPNARRIIAYGLRNPFRFAFRPGTNEMWIGDVGWNSWEEINRIMSPTDATVENFGWPCYEGSPRQSSYDSANLNICENLYAENAVTSPYFAYHHNNKVVSGESCPTGSSSISGISFEFSPTGSSYPPAYQRALYFADYSRNCIWVMKKDASGVPAPGLIETFDAGASGPVNLEFSPGGDLYYADLNTGTIRRIQYTQSAPPPPAGTNYVSDLTWTSMTNGWGPAEKDMSNGEANAGDGRTLTLNGVTYAKGLGAHSISDVRYNVAGCSRFKAEVGIDDEVPGSNGSVVFQVFAGTTKVYESGLMNAASATTSVDVSIAGASELRLVVTDGGDTITYDHADWALARVECSTNQAPVPVIDTPASGLTWKVGDAISFSGYATDPEQGALPASALSWALVIQHCPSNCHSHPIQSWPGVASGSFNAPDHEYPSYLELTLTGTDSQGASASTTLRLDPRTVGLTFQSEPSGLQIVVNSSSSTTPFTRTVIEGSTNSVSATTPQILNETTYEFSSWSDGGAQTHNVTAPPGGSTYTATYAPSGTSSCASGQLTAQYFANTTLSGTAALTRCEAAPLNDDWGAGGPGSPLPSDNFSARWTGSFSFPAGDTTFSVTADDGIRLYVDGTLVIDKWIDQPATTYTATRTLTAGAHDIKIEYYENGGQAVAKASW